MQLPKAMTHAADTKKILLVDIHDVFRQVTAQLLEAMGYRVACAPGPLPALEVLGDQGADILVAELAMPRMSGVDLAAKLRGRGPVAVVLMASCIAGAARRHLSSQGFVVLEKPFSARQLEAGIRRAMAGRE